MAHKAARMKTKGGELRFVPFFQIEFWIKKKIFAELGYTFADDIGEKEYAEWIEEKARAAAIAEAKKGSGPTMADGGIADAHMHVGGRSTAEAIMPEKTAELPVPGAPGKAPETAPPQPAATEGEDAVPVEDDVEVKESI